MAVAVNDIVLLSFRGTQAGQRIIFTHTYRVVTAGDGAGSYPLDMSEFIVAVSAAGNLRQKYLACLTSAYTLNEIRAQVVAPTRRVFVSVAQIGQVGTYDGTGNVTNLSAAITLRTLLAGRKQTSTKKIGPIASDASSAGLLDALLRTPLDALKTQMIADVVPSGFDVPGYRPVVYHRDGTTAPTRSDDIVTGVVQLQTRTMSRRTVGRGE